MERRFRIFPLSAANGGIVAGVVQRDFRRNLASPLAVDSSVGSIAVSSARRKVRRVRRTRASNFDSFVVNSYDGLQ
jgi:hypothetical protein